MNVVSASSCDVPGSRFGVAQYLYRVRSIGGRESPLSEAPRRETFLPFAPHDLDEDAIDEVVDTLRSDWITTGPKVALFEREFSEALNGVPAFAVSSCTAAIHLALLSLGIGPGDAVLTTPMTFCSTVHAIEHVGARPVLVDVERDTLNIDPQAIEHALSTLKHSEFGTPRAILPVHFAGHPCEMAAILEIAARHDLAVIEDAAHAIGARYASSPVGEVVGGNVRRAACFSFYATKNMTTAEGGMLTGDASLIADARIWGLHGMSRDAWSRYERGGAWRYEVEVAGFKYNMTDVQAALGVHQLRKLDQMQKRRHEIAAHYDDGLSDVDEIELPTVRPDVVHARHLYPIRLQQHALTLPRDEVIGELAAENIGCSVHFIPVHHHRYYRDRYGLRREDFPVTSDAFERIISLPIYPRMSDEDVFDVLAAVRRVIARHRR